MADADYFFGRDLWRDIIVDNLLAYRISILYGTSGIGKSSVLSAGVLHQLRARARANFERDGTPELVAAAYSGWGKDRKQPLIGMEASLHDAVASVSPSLTDNPPTGSLASILDGWSERVGGRVLLILDQFEEYFVYQQEETGDRGFAAELANALTRRDLEANFLISIREDALAKLDHFEEDVPGLLDHLIRIEHLDSDGAREAINGAVDRWNHDRGDSIVVEPQLVDEILTQVQTRRVLAGQGGHGIAHEAADDSDAIEAPYLQLVLTRLWEEEQTRSSKQLRSSTLTSLGGVHSIVETHLDRALSVLSYDERYVAAQVFHYLVTPSGTKIAHTSDDLAKYSEVDSIELEPVLAKLAKGNDRVLRAVEPPPGSEPSDRYEIFHDVLAHAVIDWRTRFMSDRARRHQVSIAVARAIQLLLGLTWALLFVAFVVFSFNPAAAESDDEWWFFAILAVWSAFALLWWGRAARRLARARRRRYRRLWLIPLAGGVWGLLGPLATIPIFGLWLWRRRRARRRGRAAPAVSQG